ncbi:MAG: hypothetical protein HQ456_02255 [Polynucleobacter sp.]|nr:hypothetical protein [Polynucleobacter sp.]
MGYTFATVKYLLTHSDFFKNKKVLTLGTLFPYITTKQRHHLACLGFAYSDESDFSRQLFIKKLGAKSVSALDVSDYQGAEVIWNLNTPILSCNYSTYDAVIDLGTLEHLSNNSIALTNIFWLLAARGRYYYSCVMNNWVDHGFFQFSPTFFFDMCRSNRSLNLLEIQVCTTSYYHPICKPNCFPVKLALASRERSVFTGCIETLPEKNPIGVNLNFIQSSYEFGAHAVNISSSRHRSGLLELLKSLFLLFYLNSPFTLTLKLKTYSLACIVLGKKNYLDSNYNVLE